jgi:hypothetical protein
MLENKLDKFVVEGHSAPLRETLMRANPNGR